MVMAATVDPSTIWSSEPGWKDLYGFPSHALQRQAGKLHFVREGEANRDHGTVVCVHGNPTWSFMWRDLIREMRTDFQVVAPDHMGCGLSDVPTKSEYGYSLDDRVADLTALMNEVAPTGPIHLVVHDWGGMIGTSWALGDGVRERVASITALNTACFLLPTGKPFPWMLRILKSVPKLAELAVRSVNLFAAAAAATCTVTPLPRAVRDGLLYPYRSWSRRTATHWFVQDIPESPKDPAYARARRTDDDAPAAFAGVPVFLPWGLRDYIFDGDYLAEWQRRFPQARALPFEHCGHYLLEDAGEIVIPAIAQHIRQAAGRPEQAQ
jgi:pimeloyl-ACP methyl ester carboxylesterase